MDVMGIDVGALLPFIAVGLAAQAVDGALGMAFGVISNTVLVALVGGRLGTGRHLEPARSGCEAAQGRGRRQFGRVPF